MLKGILLSVIIVACAASGRTISNVHKRRVEVIAELLAAIRVLRIRMLNSLEPVGILLRKSEAPLFQALGNSLGQGASLSACWEELRAASTRRGKMLDSLTESDLHILDALFMKLGTSGKEEQNALFSMIISHLEEAQEQAKNKNIEAEKLYTTLGALLGIGISVLIA